MSEDPVLNATEAAKAIGVHKQTLYDYLVAGELKGAKHGNRWFIRQSWVEEFLSPTRTDAA